VSLLARVSEALRAAGVHYALIGASAMTIHGVNRSTIDVDLFVLDPACLDRRLWGSLAAEGVAVEIRRGDPDDPLAGVVRFETPLELPVDVVVGKYVWQRKTIERARTALFAGVEVPVLTGVDLILLKLYAGGPQDTWDIQQILAGPERESLIAGVERELPELPKDCSRLWRRILDPIA
jgi:predicted nucleotidyltransferase